MPRALLYLRQSDSDGHGEHSLSLDSQSAVLRRDAVLHDWTIVAEVRDPDLRGYDDARPGLLELYTRCRAREVDLVAFWSLDRLARSVRIQENVVYELTQLGVDLFSHEEPWINEPFLRQVVGAANEHRTREIAAHVRRTLRQKQADGIHHGRVPWGYVRPAVDAPLAIDPAPAEIVRQIYAWRASGIGPAAIAGMLLARGTLTPRGGIWSTQQVMALLARISYRGAVRCGEEIIEDAHPAIVDAALWHAAQAGDEPGRHPRRKAIVSPYEGLVEHGCGQPMYLFLRRPPARDFYRCRLACRGGVNAAQVPCAISPRSVVAARLEVMIWEAITADLRRLRPPRTIIAEAKRAYARMTTGDRAEQRAAAEALRRRALAERERVAELYISGAYDRTWFDARDARALTMLHDAECQLATLPAAPDAAEIEAEWETLRDLRAALRDYGPAERGQVLRTLGIAVVHPAGVPLMGRGGGRGDAGRVVIRYRPGIDRFFAHHNGA